MKKTLLFTAFLSFQSLANGYAYYATPSKTNSTISKMRMACPNCDSTKETFYGESMTPSGFSMIYSESYVRVMKYCYKLSTNANKMMTRALTQNDKKTLKRLDCYTKGLGRDLLDLEINEKTALDLAREHNNTAAINYIESLR